MHSLTRRYGLLAVPFGVLVGHLVGYRLAHPGASSRDAALGSTHGYLGVSTWVGLALAIVALGLAAREGARGQRSGFTAATLLRAGVVVPGVLIAGATAGWRKALALGALLLVVVSVLQAVGIAMAPGSTGSALTRLFAGGVYIIPAWAAGIFGARALLQGDSDGALGALLCGASSASSAGSWTSACSSARRSPSRPRRQRPHDPPRCGGGVAGRSRARVPDGHRWTCRSARNPGVDCPTRRRCRSRTADCRVVDVQRTGRCRARRRRSGRPAGRPRSPGGRRVRRLRGGRPGPSVAMMTPDDVAIRSSLVPQSALEPAWLRLPRRVPADARTPMTCALGSDLANHLLSGELPPTPQETLLAALDAAEGVRAEGRQIIAGSSATEWAIDDAAEYDDALADESTESTTAASDQAPVPKFVRWFEDDGDIARLEVRLDHGEGAAAGNDETPGGRVIDYRALEHRSALPDPSPVVELEAPALSVLETRPIETCEVPL